MSNAATGAGRIFSQVFEKIENVIEYSRSWENKTGYLDNAASIVNLKPAEMAKSVDHNGRRIILIGTRFGTVVVFDRFIGQTNGGVYVTNAPRNYIFRALMSGTAVGEQEMALLLGSWGIIKENIGYVIEQIAQDFVS